MNAAEIAARLGVAHRSGKWWRCVCPVHGSRTGDSATLALLDVDRGPIVKCWAGCDPREVKAELRSLIGDRVPASVPRGTDYDVAHVKRAQNDFADLLNGRISPADSARHVAA